MKWNNQTQQAYFKAFSILLIFFLSFQFTFLVLGHTYFPENYYAAKEVGNTIQVKHGWYVEESDWFTSSKHAGHFETYVKLRNSETRCWVNDFVDYNRNTGEIVSDFGYDPEPIGFEFDGQQYVVAMFEYQGVCDGR